MIEENKTKYIIYARKSSESEDRQVQSIDDQIKKLKELAMDLNIDIVKIFTESKSAKQPNSREVFEEALNYLESKKANGILCWQLNRLSRNPVDSARVQWMLQERLIDSIRTIEREFRPDDNQLLFSVESGMANQFILDLRKNTIRGMIGKLERGGYISRAPLGYMNDKINKTIIKDPERFNLIRKAWDLVLSEEYSAMQTLAILNDKWHFKTPLTKRGGDNPLSVSGFYRILSNKTYTGVVTYKGKEYQGTHEPMISLSEYYKVQDILGRKDKPKPQTHNFAFTGMIRCGNCGCLITAEKKQKHIKSTGENKTYIYYRCTRRKLDYHCQQKPIKLENLEDQIVGELNKYVIPKEFASWALGVLKQNHEDEVVIRNKELDRLNDKYTSLQSQLDNLTKIRLKDLINDDEFERQRNELTKEINRVKEKLAITQDRAINWVDIMEKAFNFVVYAKDRFETGDDLIKRKIFLALGKSYNLKDGKLTVNPVEWLIPISNHQKNIKKDMQMLEPKDLLSNKSKNPDTVGILTRWGD